MEYYVAGLVKSLAEKLVYIAPLDAHAHHFYLTPETHVIEGFWALLFSFIFIYGMLFTIFLCIFVYYNSVALYNRKGLSMNRKGEQQSKLLK